MWTLKTFQKCTLFVLFLILNFKTYSIEPIKLVTGNDFPPYTDEKLKNGGMYTSILKSILNRLKIPYIIEFYPWARGYDMVKNGKFDATFPYAFTEERSKDVKFSRISLVESPVYLFANIKFKNKKNIDGLKGTTYCNPVGYYNEDTVLKILNKNEIKKISKFDEKSCIDAIINNEADFMVSSEMQINEYKKQKIKFFNQLTKIGKPINKLKLFLIYNKNFDNNIIKKIDNESIDFKNTTEYEEILKSY